MRTPIADFLESYESSGAVRLHMPGHKGRLGYSHDLTEVTGADVLYSPTGIIRESEKYAAELFGTARTVYSTEGSSLSIKAMMALISFYARERGEKPTVLAVRNVHRSFINAAALLDLDVEWIYSKDLISAAVTAEELEKALTEAKKKPTAVYVTSPDYLGHISDIHALAEVCHREGVLLAVDNAHGAYMRFLPEDRHPITLGADICCDSAHKTLPVLTGGGYLHISKKAPDIFADRADEAMSLFATTSPSYLILESLDLANRHLAENYRSELEELLPTVREIKARLTERGFELYGDEELKITVKTKKYGYTGRDFSEILEKKGYYSEFADDDFLTVMITPCLAREELLGFADALTSVKGREPITAKPPRVPFGTRVTSIREAMLSPSDIRKAEDCLGLVLSDAAVSCPPAIPILIPGEQIDEDAIEAFGYYGINNIRVIKKVLPHSINKL